MKKKKSLVTQLTLVTPLALLLASHTQASGTKQNATTNKIHVAELKVKTTQVIGLDGKSQETKYEVDGIEIELTPSDRAKAKNWNLRNEDWVKYKYAMEYTPRGIWSPDLDPPIVLGNLSKTEAERARYSRVMNALELDRRHREIAFQLTAIYELPTEEADEIKPSTALSRALPPEKTILKSIFIDTATCEKECIHFVLLETAGTSTRTKLNIIFTTDDKSKQEKILLGAGITNTKIRDKQITVVTDAETTQQYREGFDFPFLIIQNDEGLTRRDISS